SLRDRRTLCDFRNHQWIRSGRIGSSAGQRSDKQDLDTGNPLSSPGMGYAARDYPLPRLAQALHGSEGEYETEQRLHDTSCGNRLARPFRITPPPRRSLARTALFLVQKCANRVHETRKFRLVLEKQMIVTLQRNEASVGNAVSEFEPS